MLLLFGNGEQSTAPAWSADGYSYYEPKKKDIERMLKAWGALEDFENYTPPPPPPETEKPKIVVPPASDYRKPAYQPKPKAKFEWWKQ
jgi:hypothetical protein